VQGPYQAAGCLGEN